MCLKLVFKNDNKKERNYQQNFAVYTGFCYNKQKKKTVFFTKKDVVSRFLIFRLLVLQYLEFDKYGFTIIKAKKSAYCKSIYSDIFIVNEFGFKVIIQVVKRLINTSADLNSVYYSD